MDRLSLRGIVAGVLLAAAAAVVLAILLFPAKPADLNCGSWLDPTITEGDRQFLNELGPYVDQESAVAQAVETCDDRLALHGWLAVGAGASGSLVALAGFIAVPRGFGRDVQPPPGQWPPTQPGPRPGPPRGV